MNRESPWSSGKCGLVMVQKVVVSVAWLWCRKSWLVWLGYGAKSRG